MVLTMIISQNFQKINITSHHQKWVNLLKITRIIIIGVHKRILVVYLSSIQTFGQPLSTLNRSKNKRDRKEF